MESLVNIGQADKAAVLWQVAILLAFVVSGLLLAWMEGGFRNMINNVRPVDKPGDVAGVKFRVMQNPVYISMFSSLGGTAIPMAWGETFTAVQQGAIDGLEIHPTGTSRQQPV